jgi:hypothetical protein
MGNGEGRVLKGVLKKCSKFPDKCAEGKRFGLQRNSIPDVPPCSKPIELRTVPPDSIPTMSPHAVLSRSRMLSVGPTNRHGRGNRDNALGGLLRVIQSVAKACVGLGWPLMELP